MNKKYAVIFEYSFDAEIVVHLFAELDKAKAFLKSSFEHEVKIDKTENGYDVCACMDDDGMSASITNRFFDHTDTTWFKIGSVYGE